MSTDILLQIFQIMFPIVAIVSVGVLIGKRNYPNLDSVNDINLNVFVPALVFASLAKQQFSFNHYALLGVCGLALVLLTAALAIPLARLLKQPYKTIGPPMMFHNAGNVGLPLMALAFGPEGLAAGLILFLVGNITHFGLGSYLLDKNPHILRSLTSPAIIAAALAFIIQSNEIAVASFVMLPIEMLGNIAVPMMLFSLGTRLAHAKFDHWRLGLLIGLLTPVVGIIITFGILSVVSLAPLQIGVLIMFSVLPPAVMNFLFAERYQQEPTKVSAIVLIGNSVAVVTLPLALLYVLPNYT